jgi:hypothetical protein
MLLENFKFQLFSEFGFRLHIFFNFAGLFLDGFQSKTIKNSTKIMILTVNERKNRDFLRKNANFSRFLRVVVAYIEFSQVSDFLAG